MESFQCETPPGTGTTTCGNARPRSGSRCCIPRFASSAQEEQQQGVADPDQIGIPAIVNVQFPDGTIEAVTAYYTGTAADGSTFVLLLDLLCNAISLGPNLIPS
jgi:hypothetical protein